MSFYDFNLIISKDVKSEFNKSRRNPFFLKDFPTNLSCFTKKISVFVCVYYVNPVYIIEISYSYHKTPLNNLGELSDISKLLEFQFCRNLHVPANLNLLNHGTDNTCFLKL